jgi:hypothetical protein
MASSSPGVPMRRLAVIAAVLFVAILALLAGRVKAGADPAQPVSSAPSSQQPAQPEYQDPYAQPDPYAAPDPYGGEAIPGGPPNGDPGPGGAGGFGGDQGGSGVAPPTQAS